MKIFELRAYIATHYDDDLIQACEIEFGLLEASGQDEVSDPGQFIDEVEIKHFHVNAHSEQIMSAALHM